MARLCIFVGTLGCGYAAWAAAAAIGLGTGAAFLLSGAGSLLGVYLGWKLARKLE